MSSNYISSKQAQKHFKVSEQTLRDWANNGKIEFIRTDGGHRRYKLKEINKNKLKIVYARVSSKKQDVDLQRQIGKLREEYPDYKIITDIGSGINFKRKGFKKILQSLFKGCIEEVVVASGDRFSRIGFELFFWMFKEFGAKLTVLDKGICKSDSEELADDLMEIITVFTARYYCRRRYNNKKTPNIS